jgi:hypothetical protein
LKISLETLSNRNASPVLRLGARCDADPLEKVIAHCRCERCDTTWEEVIYDGDEIVAELRRVEEEIESNPIRYESGDDPRYSFEEFVPSLTLSDDGGYPDKCERFTIIRD